MNNEKEIKFEDYNRKHSILSNFANNGIEKSISQDEFEKSYGQGNFEIYSQKSVNKFIADAIDQAKDEEGNVSDEVVKAVTSEVEGLKPVVVKGEQGYSKFFVKETAESKETNEEDTDLSVEDETVSKGDTDYGALLDEATKEELEESEESEEEQE